MVDSHAQPAIPLGREAMWAEETVFAGKDWHEAYLRSGLDGRAHSGEGSYPHLHAHKDRLTCARVLVVGDYNGLADYSDIRLPETSSRLYDLAQSLSETYEPDVIVLPRVLPTSALWSLVPQWPGCVTVLRGQASPVCLGTSHEEYLQTLSGKARKEASRQNRKRLSSEVSWSLVEKSPKATAPAIDDLLEWHLRNRREKTSNPTHLKPAFRSLLYNLSLSSSGYLVRFTASSTVYGYALFLVDSSAARNYVVGYDRSVGVKLSDNLMEVLAAIDLFGHRCSYVDLLRGAHTEKCRFASSVIVTRMILLSARPRVRSELFSAVQSARQLIRGQM